MRSWLSALSPQGVLIWKPSSLNAKRPHQVKANGGDYTLAFWIRPLGVSSLHTDGRFYPQVQFLSSISPPTHNLAWGLFASNPNGESRMFSSCSEGTTRNYFENVENRAASATDWTFLSISRKNSSSIAGEVGEITVTTNLLMDRETSEVDHCFFDQTAFFTALEVNYDVLMSPIMMIPKTMSVGAIQEMYYSSASTMATRTGPKSSTAKRQTQSKISVEKADFVPRTVILAPPLLFQTRTQKTIECSFSYSQD